MAQKKKPRRCNFSFGRQRPTDRNETDNKNPLKQNSIMKTMNVFKALAFAAISLVSILSSEVKAQDNFITNEEVKNNLVVSRTIYKQDGNYLHNHLHYEFAYDDQNRLVSKTATKWDGATDKWTPYFQMTYRYEAGEVVMSYARWSESDRSYTKDVKQTVYELNENNIPVACRQQAEAPALMADRR